MKTRTTYNLKLITVFTILFFSAFSAKAQMMIKKEDYTLAILKISYNCNCSIQYARNDKPSGPIFELKNDSISVAVHKNYSGIFVRCNNTKERLIKVPFQPEGYFLFTIKNQPCTLPEKKTNKNP